MDLAFNTSSNTTSHTPTGECYPSFNDDLRCDVILGFRRAIAIVSMLCCLFVVFIIILFKKYKFLHQRLILYLSIAAFFQAIGYAMADYHISHKAMHGEFVDLCIFQGIYTLFFDWLSFLWVCCITFNIFWNAVFLKSSKKFEKFYAIVCFVVPVVVCCFPFIGHSYGPAGLWCWISSYRDLEVLQTGVVLQFVVFYGPIWLLSLVLLVALVTVACLIKSRTRKYHGTYNPQLDSQKKLWEEEIRPLLLFPWIYLFILVFPVMNRLRQAFGYFEPDSGWNFFFWFMHSVTLTLHGTLYALVFACDKQTRSRITYKHMKGAVMYRWNKKVEEYPMEQSGAFTASDEKDDLVPTDTNYESANGIYTLYTDTQQE